MSFARLAGAALLAATASLPARAQEFKFDGFADFRVFKPSNQVAWSDGGLGKIGFDGGGPHTGPGAQLGEVVGDGTVQLTPDLAGFATLRWQPQQMNQFSPLELYGRYRPVSTTPLRWSVKFGAFFPPISLENTETGWTSPWTLTPSAINTWVGEELRTIGAEGTVEWRYQSGTIAAKGAVFGWNDGAGTLLADRGWAFGDRPTGLFDSVPLPDAFAAQIHTPPPLRTAPFADIAGTPGWYGGLSWDHAGIGHLDLLHYDNRSDPAASDNHVFAWQTDFTSAGFEKHIDNFALLSQAMTGRTVIFPVPFARSETRFQSAYLLAGLDIGEWRPAVRVDVFATQENGLRSEHGYAATLALTWHPKDWLRVTGELLHVDSSRAQRTVAGLSPQAAEDQFEICTRLFF